MNIKIVRTGILVALLFATLLVLPTQPAYADACNSTGTGNWNTVGTWSCSHVPTNVDDVTILSGHTVTLDTDATIASLTVNGTLTFGNSTTGRILSVIGSLEIASGGTIQINNNNTAHTLNISGNFTNNGTFNGRANPNRVINVNLNGTGAQTISGTPTTFLFNNLTVSNAAGSVSANTNFSVGGTFTVNTNATFSPGESVVINPSGAQGTITGSGTIRVTRITATPDYSSQYQFSTDTLSNMTVDYAGAGNQTISSFTYGSLITSGSGTKTISAATTVNNSVVINTGTILDVSTRTMTIGGTLTVYGTLDFSDSTGLIRTSTSGTTTLTMGANGLIRTVDQDGLGPAPNASLQTQGSGVWNTTSISNNGTVEYYRSTTSGQTVTDRDYNNLTITGSSQIKTWTLGGTRTVNGNITINSGAPFTLSGAQTLNVRGNWTNNGGTFTPGTSTVVFNGGGTSTLSRTTGVGLTETFCNLTLNAGTLLDTTDDYVAVLGNGGCGALTVNGQLRRETPAQNVTGAGTWNFNDAWNLNAVRLTRTSTGNNDLGSTTVTIRSNLQPTTCGSVALGGSPVLRLYDIQPSNNGPYNQYTLRLYFRTSNPNESNGNTIGNLAIYHCDGTTWTRLPGTGGSDANGSYVEVTGVNTFSPFAIGGGPGAPTAVTLSSFSASPTSHLPMALPGIVLSMLLGGSGGLWWWRQRAQR